MDRERVEGKSFLLCRLAVLCSFFVVLLLWGFASSWCNLRLACVCVLVCVRARWSTEQLMTYTSRGKREEVVVVV